MTPLARTLCLWAAFVAGSAMLASTTLGAAEPPVLIRVEPLTVPPATRPLVSVVVRNVSDHPCQGTLMITAADDWRIAPDTQSLELAALDERRFAFNIERARNVEVNQYPFTVVADVGGHQVRWEQTVFVASAPYSRVTVDGNRDEWKDAIPVSFEHAGRQTTVSTYWNRRRFCVLVAVQEEQHMHYAGPEGPPCDAVQLAIAPLTPPDAAAGTAGRFEFLLAATANGARCFQLAAWDTPRELAAQPRALEPLVCDEAELAVVRDGLVTYYECSLPFSLVREAIVPDVGREFFLSVLVHDPDGTGPRDLGQAAGLWTDAYGAWTWSRWGPMARRDELPPGTRVRWGLCTSKY